MALTKYKIGDLIEPFTKRCGIPDLKPEQVSGINIDKEFFAPARQVGDDTTDYKIVPPQYFACNLMHVGRDKVLPVALNHSNENKIVSPAYTIFKIRDERFVIKEYFYILLNSNEKDRYFWFHTDASVRQGLPWEDFCDIEITLPDLPTQRRFVDVYLSLQNNLAAYQAKIDDLKLVCDGYIENLRRNMPCEKIGEYIQEEFLRNIDYSLGKDDVLGVTKDKVYIHTVADLNGIDLINYKVVKPRWFAYSNRINIGSIALRYDTPCLVSPSYTCFSVKEDKLLAEYLLLWLQRDEFLHYAFFYSMGTVKDELEVENIQEMQIPIPDISIQREIVNIHKCYIERQRIAAQLKEQIKNICPILIKGSLQNN